eukprot:scaffold94297_cov17-Tisochrysis_lutea.AAC.1
MHAAVHTSPAVRAAVLTHTRPPAQAVQIEATPMSTCIEITTVPGFFLGCEQVGVGPAAGTCQQVGVRPAASTCQKPPHVALPSQGG